MPKEVKSGGKTVEATLDQHSYPSNIDRVGDNKAFEGSSSGLPGKETNPIPGAEGKLPTSRPVKP